MVERVQATAACLELIDQLREKHGPLMFHQSGGCCDGSSPMCFAQGDLFLGDQDKKLGEIGGCPFYIHEDQYEYWKHTQLIIDVVDGRGGIQTRFCLGDLFIQVACTESCFCSYYSVLTG
ncbi:DUF779 domain-containing protein [Exiguobacterium sp.]|uniref:DUF779 domain-containing protein n=1 Tax=Exiguobacterium sp. TaxID=44751 RepID=UPI0028A8A4C0|nr:DUF779 domain-containing protein [Exiguobacterium sp.]